MRATFLFFLALGTLHLAGAGILPAQEEATAVEEPDALAASQAQAFLGYWLLEVPLGERIAKMGLEFDGGANVLSALLVSPFGEMTGKDFRREGDELHFVLSSGFGEFMIAARIEGGRLLGKLSNDTGQLAADFTGTESDRVTFELFTTPDNETRVVRGEQMVRLRFVEAETGGQDFQRIETLQPGQVLPFVEHQAIKLTTDMPLVVGGLEIPTDNVAEDYPGVYSLWLKRGGEGWSLVFNNKPDVWGTQHDPAADHGEVPLQQATASEPSEALVVALEESDEGSWLRFTWGSHTWSTPFEIVTAAGAEG